MRGSKRQMKVIRRSGLKFEEQKRGLEFSPERGFRRTSRINETSGIGWSGLVSVFSHSDIVV